MVEHLLADGIAETELYMVFDPAKRIGCERASSPIFALHASDFDRDVIPILRNHRIAERLAAEEAAVREDDRKLRLGAKR